MAKTDGQASNQGLEQPAGESAMPSAVDRLAAGIAQAQAAAEELQRTDRSERMQMIVLKLKALQSWLARPAATPRGRMRT